jgi:polyhydroxybutyrate depolymerase
VVVAGVTRSYLMAVPATSGPSPVVIDYHGYQQSARQQDAYTGLASAGTRAGFIVLTPDGYRGQWNFVRRAAVGPDDIAFAVAMLDDAEQHACVDIHRVTATGMSDGADMADALACALPGRVAAVAPVAPSVFPAGCAAATSYLEIHGTGDPIVPYGGGGGDRPPPFEGTEAQPVLQRYGRWQALAGCPPATRSVLAADVTQLRSSCPGGRDVSLVTVAGGGHTWPGAVGPPPAPGLGATSTQISADQVILRFLAVHRV